MAVDIAQLLAFAVKRTASDLHLSSGVPPMIRVDGDMKRINMPPLSHKEVHSMVYDIMNDKQRKAYEEFFETDFSFEIPKLARFRVNAFNQNRGAGAVFRNIPSTILSLDELNAPKSFRDLCMLPRGLVLVTGPTGSGKSTTLAGMVNHCNDNRPDHIITIEDPIEFVHESKRCLVNQREVHRDTLGFSEALRSALREDPDVILVGDRKSTRLNSSHSQISYAVFCLKKKKSWVRSDGHCGCVACASFSFPRGPVDWHRCARERSLRSNADCCGPSCLLSHLCLARIWE